MSSDYSRDGTQKQNMDSGENKRWSLADIIGIAVAGLIMPFVIPLHLGAIPVVLIYLAVYWIVKTAIKYVLKLDTAQRKVAITALILIFIVIPIVLFVSIKIYIDIYAKTFQESVNNDCPIMVAIANNDLIQAKRLIKAGENIDAKAPNGWTALTFAARENRKEALLLLLKAGANPNVRDKYKWSPLHHAILPKMANNEVITILIKYGADVNIRDSRLRAPLHRAAQYGYYQTVKLLLDRGADPKVKDENGFTPADRGASYPDIVKLLDSYRR